MPIRFYAQYDNGTEITAVADSIVFSTQLTDSWTEDDLADKGKVAYLNAEHLMSFTATRVDDAAQS